MANLRVNSTGDVVAGAGSGRISLNNVAIGYPGGSPCFLTDTRILYVGTISGRTYDLYCYDMVTRSSYFVKSGGASLLCAGGGVWARFLANGQGIDASDGWTHQKGRLLDVGPDGAIYYCPDYQAGKGIRVRTQNGVDTEILSASQVTALDLRGTWHGCIWAGYDGQLHGWGSIGPRIAQLDGRKWMPSAVQSLDGNWWVTYQHGENLVTHPATNTRGWRYGPLEHTFYPDSGPLRAHVLRVAHSLGQGAQPGAIKTYDLDLTKPAVDLNPAPPVPPAKPTATIVSYMPQEGPVPLTVTAVWRATNDQPIDRVIWMLDGQAVAINPPYDADHHFEILTPGEYRISLRVEGPGGSDQTALPRIVRALPGFTVRQP